MSVFVTVGTNEAPFDRLVRAVDRLPGQEDVIVQRGSSSVVPERGRAIDFLPFNSIVEHVRDARVVVSHAGVGSVIVALANGKRPVVVPRLACLGEAVDDHQVTFARRLAAIGLVQLVDDLEQLPAAVDAAEAGGSVLPEASGRLAEDLGRFIEAAMGDLRPEPAA